MEDLKTANLPIVPMPNSQIKLPIEDNVILDVSQFVQNQKFDLRDFDLSVIQELRSHRVLGRLKVNNKEKYLLEFEPERAFVVAPSSESKEGGWTGFKPNSNYSVVLSRNGREIAQNKFRTVDIDYGIYWLNKDGRYLKHSKLSQSPSDLEFFDPSKPTVLYLHGWQRTTSERDFFRENPLVYNDPYFGKGNVAQRVKEVGVNFAIFYWNQFADEDSVDQVAKKIWEKPTELDPIRARLSNGSYVKGTETESFGEILAKVYPKLGKVTQVVAHSLGNQLFASAASYLLSQNSDSLNSLNRVTMLDPYWTSDKISRFGNKGSIQLGLEVADKLMARQKVALEIYKSSLIGNWIFGEKNEGMEMRSAVHCLKPESIPFYAQANRHMYAYAWYFNRGFFEKEDKIFEKMNKPSSGKLHKFVQSQGRDTIDAKDDSFEEQTESYSIKGH